MDLVSKNKDAEYCWDAFDSSDQKSAQSVPKFHLEVPTIAYNANKKHRKCFQPLESLNNLQRELDIFISDAPNYFKRVLTYYEHKHFHIVSKNNHCEFNYNGVDLIIGRKTVTGHVMMMVIGNEMHEVGTLHDDHFPISLINACPPPEETPYSCFLKYGGFANTCFSTEARDNTTL